MPRSPMPHWLEEVPETDRAAALLRFRLRQAALYASPEGHMVALSKRIGLGRNALGEYTIGGRTQVPAKVAVKIEQATGGAVSRQDLNPIFRE